MKIVTYKNPIPQKKSIEKSINMLPISLKKIIIEEFKWLDILFRYNMRNIKNKILELQAQIEVLQCKANKSLMVDSMQNLISPENRILIDTLHDSLSSPVSQSLKKINSGELIDHYLGSQTKILELQTQIGKLQNELNQKSIIHLQKKCLFLSRDQVIFEFLVKKVQKTLKARKNLYVEFVCSCKYRTVKTEYPKKIHMCAPLTAIVKQLEEQGYFPECKVQFLIRNDDYNVKHFIACDK